MGNRLSTRIFISTRPKNQNEDLRRLIENEGAQLLEMPTIDLQPVVLGEKETALFRQLDQFSWIVFTSPSGIHFFFHFLKAITGSYHMPASVKIAVVGKKTEQLLPEYGHESTLTNPGNTGAELAVEMKKAINASDRLLFPEGSLARGIVAEALSAVAPCTSLLVYQNNMPEVIDQEILQEIILNHYDAIILTSPSGFINLIHALPADFDQKQLRLICIGTTTEAEVRSNGLIPLATAVMSNAQGIVQTILEVYQPVIKH
ncbi:MAG: uroporphyrinogen-III synthase [Prolixibacteraceae bacterium]|nr:uroporphyrinogen-III synthase [Prolixibacteraceae bacterium]